MTLRIALEKAAKELEEANPLVVAARSGATFEAGAFHLRLLDQPIVIRHPGLRLEEADSGREPPPEIRLLLLHYLLGAQGVPLADRWIAFRELPGGYVFEAAFENRCFRPLEETFRHDIEGFRRAGLVLGGTFMDRMGDAAFRFLALPRIALGCILYLGEEGLPPAVNIVFDAAAPSYLPTEDLAFLAEYLSGALRDRADPYTGK